MAGSNQQYFSKADLHFIKSLQRKNLRSEHRMLVAEGDKLVAEVLTTGLVICFLVVTKHSEHCTVPGALLVGENEMERMTGLSSPSPSLVVARQPEWPVSPVSRSLFTPVLDEVRDPGNLGTIIRTADWFGYDRVICSRNTADMWNPKTIQASMGSVFRVPVYYTDLEVLFTENNSVPVYLLDMEGRALPECRDLKPGFLVLGNEANGLSRGTLASATERISIPGKGGAESLNVSVAAAITMFFFSGI